MSESPTPYLLGAMLSAIGIAGAINIAAIGVDAHQCSVDRKDIATLANPSSPGTLFLRAHLRNDVCSKAKQDAATALGNKGGDGVISALSDSLLRDASPDVRKTDMRVLAKLNDYAPIESAATDDQDSDVRALAGKLLTAKTSVSGETLKAAMNGNIAFSPRIIYRLVL